MAYDKHRGEGRGDDRRNERRSSDGTRSGRDGRGRRGPRDGGGGRDGDRKFGDRKFGDRRYGDRNRGDRDRDDRGRGGRNQDRRYGSRDEERSGGRPRRNYEAQGDSQRPRGRRSYARGDQRGERRYGDRDEPRGRSYGDRRDRFDRKDRDADRSGGRRDSGRGRRYDDQRRGGRDQQRPLQTKRAGEEPRRDYSSRPHELRSIREDHRDPEIPDEITERDLPMKARVELKTLSHENSVLVARHLVMASMLIDTDPELAHAHALSASRRGGRVAMVREALAITAYRIGDFALALRELRTYRRISGRDDEIALMVDCERGLGRPDRAIELGHSVDRSKLDTQQQVQLAIAMSGARLDQGETELARAELEIPQLDRTRAFDFSPALFRAYAAVLEDLGDRESQIWERAADRAEAALESVQYDEYETIEIITEQLEIPEYELHPDETADAADSVGESSDGEDSADAALEEHHEPFTVAGESIDNVAVADDIESQIRAEYDEIIAEIEREADAAAEKTNSDVETQPESEASAATQTTAAEPASQTHGETPAAAESDAEEPNHTGDTQPSLFDL